MAGQQGSTSQTTLRIATVALLVFSFFLLLILALVIASPAARKGGIKQPLPEAAQQAEDLPAAIPLPPEGQEPGVATEFSEESFEESGPPPSFYTGERPDLGAPTERPVWMKDELEMPARKSLKELPVQPLPTPDYRGNRAKELRETSEF